MYKPPANSNRVKTIKMRFENQETTTIQNTNVSGVKKHHSVGAKDRKEDRNNGLGQVEDDIELKPKIEMKENLKCQLSDPIKCNIKRTPAFRLDKNTFKDKDHGFQRHYYGSIKSKVDKFRLMDDTRLTGSCDNDNFTDDDKSAVSRLIQFTKEPTINHNSSVISNNDANLTNSKNLNHDLNQLVTKMLYSEPKSQRKLKLEMNKSEVTETIHNIKTLKLTETTQSKPKNQIETAENVIDILKSAESLNGSDTIKNALKRPLPAGPAPKKPPRTFQHSSPNSQTTNRKSSTLQIEDDFAKKLNDTLQKHDTQSKTKKDPKYMLEKLETALKNNKIKLQKQKNFDYSSDDDNLRLTKSTTSSPLLKRLNETNQSQKFNFGCLNSMCTKPTYETIVESKSSFFVDKNEPIYAEPYQFDEILRKKDANSGDAKEKEQRNSLYYMSSPILGLENVENNSNFKMDDVADKEGELNRSKSLSFSTSDSDSNASTPIELANSSNSAFVKDLIKSFEHKQNEPSRTKRGGGVCLRERAKSLDRNNLSNRYGVVCDIQTPLKVVQREESKFEIYVKTVRAFSIKSMTGKQLFHCCLLVGLDEKCPYIKSKFPPNIEIPPYIEKLCFPDSEDHRINYSAKEQCYSLVVTDESGDRIYGYCRRVLPEGSCTCLPLAYCILTKHRAPRFYKRILQELESHHGLPDKQREELLKEFHQLEFPKPGHSIRLDLSKIIKSEVKYYDTKNPTSPKDLENNNEINRKSEEDLKSFCVVEQPCPHGIVNLSGGRGSGENGMKDNCPICSEVTYQTLVLTLHQDMRYEETNLKKLCETLHVNLLQKVFENLLLERKVIFISCHLSKLSSCIEAVQSVLYPFSWPHAFIPVLPKTRWEIVEAPAPLICGVLSVSVVNDYKIENAIVVDLDSKDIILEIEDDEKILPECAIKSWKKGLVAANSIVTSENEHNVLLSDAFIRVFIQTCGHYKDFIKDNSFDREGFKLFPKSKGIKRFLQWFTQTTMFDLFIDAVLTNPGSFYVFDNRINIYSSQDATLILEKMKDWKKL
ncbi:DENN domain-containing protein 2B-like [Onthophagus taurus]|uniref:DENN domain-containing protein 2B-like n=1 Tax=Onthophagus taurus TaxID=166361 RepID=UPI0039BE801B